MYVSTFERQFFRCLSFFPEWKASNKNLGNFKWCYTVEIFALKVWDTFTLDCVLGTIEFDRFYHLWL